MSPAPLLQDEYNRLIEAGRLVTEISGSKGDAARCICFISIL